MAGLLLTQVQVLHHGRDPVHAHPSHHLDMAGFFKSTTKQEKGEFPMAQMGSPSYPEYLKTAVELLVLIELLVGQPGSDNDQPELCS